MFGFRFDGRRLTSIDPIQMIMAYLMPQRCDAQVWTPQEVDYDKVADYIQRQRELGRTVSFMSIIIAAYVRVLTENPESNRFVMNKQIFARNEIAVSFMVLKQDKQSKSDASAVKVKFDPYDTIFDVSERVEAAIAANRNPAAMGNSTERLARGLMSAPMLPTILVGGLRLLDRYGLMPRAVIDLSPFHTSLFVTNMASLGINYIYHHIYNFGTTGLFLSLGKISRKARANPNGEIVIKRVIPLGFVGDERIMNGLAYATLFRGWRKYMENPALLETPPTSIESEVIGTPEWVKHPKTKAKAADAAS
ncbi:MAG: 2-oxo acid dehydrogenase subunit E2 [Oscillospiraceae bacterium]|jgi:hypothetical protein|nr:2-oxo acid dehydrogenase subunit E2 [Oscillospiraceae bacterium]